MFCTIFMVTGLGLWIHFTDVAYFNIQKALNILELTTNESAEQVSRVYDSLVSASVIYCIFSTCIIALGCWRGWLESDQDLKGEVDEDKSAIFIYAAVALQIIWWIVFIYLVFLVAGDVVLGSWLWMISSSLDLNLQAQQLVNDPSVPASYKNMPKSINQLNCPATCFNARMYPFFGITTIDGSNSNQGCVCDGLTLRDAYDAVMVAYDAVPGILTGIWFMLIYASFLIYWMTGMFAHTRREQDLHERLKAAT